MEIWRDVVGYEGLYLVSNLGNVKSLNYRRSKKEQNLKLSVDTIGYCFVKFCVNGNCKNKLVHRLVAETFIPNPNNYPEVNHKTEIKTDNKVSQLEWCSKLYNMRYNDLNRKNHEKLINCKTTSKKVLQYDLNMNLIKTWNSASECKRNGFSQGTISSCCRQVKSFKTYRKYIWRYENENELDR
jgi:hypothetical protein